MTAPLVFTDCETTGLHPGRQAWEVAMIRRNDGNVGHENVEHFFIRADDLDMANADPKALEVGGFYERHPDYAPGASGHLLTAKNAAEEIARFTHGAHLVAANPAFDAGIYDQLLRKHNCLPAWHYHLIDIEPLMLGYIRGWMDSQPGEDLFHYDRGLLNADSTPPWSSRQLAKILGVEQIEAEAHTAWGDANWVKRVFDRVYR